MSSAERDVDRTRDAVPVFIIAQNRLLREALAQVLSKKADSRVVGAAPPSDVSRPQVELSGAKVMILEAMIEDPGFLNRVKEFASLLRVVIIGGSDNEEAFLDCIRSGAVGYLLRDSSALEVAAAVREVSQGGAVCPPRLCVALLQDVSRNASQVPGHPTMPVFFSYAAQDRHLAQQLMVQMPQDEFDVWSVDRDTLPGDNLSLEAGKALERAKALVVLLSPDAVVSKRVLSEIEYALGSESYKGRIVPVIARPVKNLPWILKRFTIVQAAKGIAETSGRIADALRQPVHRVPSLKPREEQLISLIAQGFTNKEIANHLGITTHRVRSAVQRLLRRIGKADDVERGESPRSEPTRIPGPRELRTLV
jgi:DNA-binding NarL/FixJ family response regulator